MTFPTISEMKRLLFMAAYAECCGNRKQMAKILGLHIRSVRNMIHKYGLPTLRAPVGGSGKKV
jgi:DNA-binding NtrC family response regulator